MQLVFDAEWQRPIPLYHLQGCKNTLISLHVMANV